MSDVSDDMTVTAPRHRRRLSHKILIAFQGRAAANLEHWISNSHPLSCHTGVAGARRARSRQ
jgi:hypothetical protein